jgi:hypothetical protein
MSTTVAHPGALAFYCWHCRAVHVEGQRTFREHRRFSRGTQPYRVSSQAALRVMAPDLAEAIGIPALRTVPRRRPDSHWIVLGMLLGSSFSMVLGIAFLIGRFVR